MGIQSGRNTRTTRGAFTLVELLLVVVLLGLLFSAVVFSLDSLQRGARLEEGAGQVETLLRFARARASATGRQVRIVFQPPSNPESSASAAGSSSSATGISGATATGSAVLSAESGIRVEWEPDPIGAPGRFEPLLEAAPYLEQLAGLVQIQGVGSRKPTVARTEGADSGAAGAMAQGALESSDQPRVDANRDPDAEGASTPRPPLTFYPDGSSDTVEMWVRTRDDSDGRRVVLTLAGLSGVIRQRWVSSDPSGAFRESPDLAGGTSNPLARQPSPPVTASADGR